MTDPITVPDPIGEAVSLTSLFSSKLNPLQVLLTLGLSLIAGLYIFFIYKKSFGGVMYSRSFNLSLVMLTLVTSLVMMVITHNVTLSLGMVGALSIIRFRTAVKDPIDTVFMFWAVTEGIALGAHFYDVAVIGGLVIGLIMVLVSGFKGRSSMPYLLVLHFHEAASQTVSQMVRKLPKARLKSKTVQRDGIELTVEIRIREDETGFVEKFLRVEGVFDATLISHQGDLVS
ncbi:MAG: hypothetical protein BWY11_00387 [Firmicutes bacterium ADurb.Bin182]|nr:MAG: hypothetical protein BWY11_00387 [Firmicutes bacterium ADurb.Bin182]